MAHFFQLWAENNRTRRKREYSERDRKKNESRRKMEISKLLVFLVFSLPHSIALPLFRISFVHAIVVVLHRYFSLFMWFVFFPPVSFSFFLSLSFIRHLYPLQFNCKQVAHQRDLRCFWCFCNFFCVKFIFFSANARFLIFCIVRLHHPILPLYSINLRTTLLSFQFYTTCFSLLYAFSLSHSEFEMYNCFMVKDLSLAFIFGSCVFASENSVENVIDVLMGKSSGGIQWIIVIRWRNYTKFTQWQHSSKRITLMCNTKSFCHLLTISKWQSVLCLQRDATINFIR